MNVQQILKKVEKLIFHDLTNSDLVDELNEISKQLFREFPLPDKIYRFTTTSVPYYDLPADCAEDRIRVVTIDDTDYEMVAPEVQSIEGPFCMMLVGKLYVNPNREGADAFVYYRPRHVELSSDDLNATPSFPEDYHDRLVFGLARYAAMTQRDVDLVNNFQAECDAIEMRAKRGLKKAGLRRVKETTSW